MSSDAVWSGMERGPGRLAGLILGPLLFGLVVAFVDLKPGDPMVTRMAAVAVWMAVWWISEAVPLAATALLPLVLYPLLGIMKGKEAAPVYVNNIIFLFVGGFMIALAMEKWSLHKRIALWIMRVVGGGPARLVLSFMMASAFLSMWISNTATAIMMLAIGLSIVGEAESVFGKEEARPLGLGIMLGIAYGCSAGGIATLVGTPPNLSFVRIFEISFPEAPSIGFGQWMLMALPLSMAILLVVWVLLTRVFFRVPPEVRLDPAIVEREREKLGGIRFAEVAVLAVFSLTAFLWVFRKSLQVGSVTIPGWGDFLPYGELIDDGTVAVGMALLLFLIPSRAEGEGESRTLLTREVFGKIPWNIVLLFGGGFVLAKGFQETGLAAFLGEQFAGLRGLSPLMTIAWVSGMLTFLTELTSNTATTEMVLPILASIGKAMGINPLLLMIPATLAASCAFMMPVATPPNAIVFASGRVRVWDMVKVGIFINLIAIVLVTLTVFVLGTAVFGIEVTEMPEWAESE